MYRRPETIGKMSTYSFETLKITSLTAGVSLSVVDFLKFNLIFFSIESDSGLLWRRRSQEQCLKEAMSWPCIADSLDLVLERTRAQYCGSYPRGRGDSLDIHVGIHCLG